MRVVFRVDGDEVSVEGYDQLNLLAHGQLAERSLQSRCGGQCACGTCRVRLVEGQLSPVREAERDLLERVGAGVGMRLACQAFPASERVVVEVPKTRFRDARKEGRG